MIIYANLNGAEAVGPRFCVLEAGEAAQRRGCEEEGRKRACWASGGSLGRAALRPFGLRFALCCCALCCFAALPLRRVRPRAKRNADCASQTLPRRVQTATQTQPFATRQPSSKSKRALL